MTWLKLGLLALVGYCCAGVEGTYAAQAAPRTTAKPALPPGEVVRLPITRDTWFSNVGKEADCNMGGASKLKLKSHQEMSLVDFDPTPLRGRAVKGALLHLRVMGNELLRRVTVSSFAADWVEGTAPSYAPQEGSSCFKWRKYPDVAWADPGSDLTAVMLGQAGTVWKSADASPPDSQGWQTVPVDPRVIAARVAGTSFGLLLFDDTGSEWTRQGEQFKLRHFPNRFVYSREAGKDKTPYLTVSLGESDVRGSSPAAKETAVGPTPEKPHAADATKLPDLGPRPTYDLTPAPLPELGSADVAILDALDKVHPATGRMTPEQSPEYLSANHLWSAARKEVRLSGAKGEFVEFQILFKGSVQDLRPELVFADAASDAKGPVAKAEFARYRCVPTKQGPLPDPVLPFRSPGDLPGPDTATGQQYSSLLCEIYIAKDAKPGKHQGTLRLTAQGGKLELPVLLTVWDFTLPDKLSFLPEMNCYGLPRNERDYYRLAHVHRTVLDRVPYSQGGSVAEGCAPEWDGKSLDWTAWDKRFGPYFDGSAFADLPRKAVPLEVFYLPLHENWPTPMEGNYNGSYWADEAFPASYRKAFAEVSRQMTEHFALKEWRGTAFLCYLNNKNNFKQNGWSRGSSPWLLDEPANFQDYWALRWFGDAFYDGVRQAQTEATSPIRMFYRGDISRPEWQRDLFDGVLTYNVVGGGAFRKYHRMVMDRKARFPQIVLDYGSTNAIEQSNMQPVGWCLDSWTLESDGVVPWQTVGKDRSWEQADELALFYPGKPAGVDGPVPSIRLKAYRRGQQDTEYLTLLTQKLGRLRRVVGQAVREALRLEGQRRGTGFTGGEDAGIIQFDKLRPQDAWAMRVQMAKAITADKSQPK